MGTDLGSAPPFSGNPNVSYTSTAEAQAGQGAEGQAAPTGTTPVAIESGDTISGLMAQADLDWNNPEHRAQFLADNPQFTEAGGRNPDLIWPGEVVYIRDPDAPPAPSEEGEQPPQVDTSQAVEGTPIRQGPYTEGYGPYMPGTTVELKDGSSLLIDDNGYPLTGSVGKSCNADGTYTYQDYENGKPVGEPYDSVPDAEGNPTTSRPAPTAEVPEVDTSQAVEGTPIRLGPYTAGYGPYMPDTTVQLNDGSSIRIDGSGYPLTGAVGTGCNVDGSYTYQNYENGVAVGEPYTSFPDENGQPTTGPES